MKQALGKGLGALIQKIETPKPDNAQATDAVQSLPLSAIDLNPQQPRKDFDIETLTELKESLKSKGILQPILVRRAGARYELIAGERRLRAARELGWTHAPALIKDASDENSLEIALIENIQRQDLNPVEEARAFMVLMRDYELTQEQVAEKLGKNRVTVANTLRLLNLPPEVHEMIEKGSLSFGHAKVLLGVENPAELIKLAKDAVAEGLSVRELEEKVQDRKRPPLHRTRILRRDPIIREMEERLERTLHTKAHIKQGTKKGKIELEYYSLDDLERLLQTLAPNPS